MPKSRRRRTDNVVTMPAVESPSVMSMRSEGTESDIARRAFELYCIRGRQHGHDVDDWLNVERELRGVASSTAAGAE
jgi:Protein of unknown function (DUF2934)